MSTIAPAVLAERGHAGSARRDAGDLRGGPPQGRADLVGHDSRPGPGIPLDCFDRAVLDTAPSDALVIEVSRQTPAGMEAVLADGFQHAAWVVGAARVRAVDDDWPAAGTRIHHSIGIWPLMINDITPVLSCVPIGELVMQARGWPAGEARVELELLPCRHAGTRGCRIVMREDATHGPGTLIPDRCGSWPSHPATSRPSDGSPIWPNAPAGRAPPAARNGRRVASTASSPDPPTRPGPRSPRTHRAPTHPGCAAALPRYNPRTGVSERPNPGHRPEDQLLVQLRGAPVQSALPEVGIRAVQVARAQFRGFTTGGSHSNRARSSCSRAGTASAGSRQP